MSHKQKPHIAFLHWIWKSKLSPSALCIDATLGNGNDALFLLTEIIPDGICIGLDLQQQAIDSSIALLKEKLPLSLQNFQFQPHVLCHSKIDNLSLPRKPDLILYNLGYLPKSNKEITTLSTTTLISLEKGLSMLSSKGIMTITIYPGHPAGLIESQEIEKWLKTLDQKVYLILKFSMHLKEDAPYVIVIEKRE
jgi:hypothetical protein